MNTKKRIIDHISRLEGQIASVKAELLKTNADCEKASKTLLSASRSFATLREQFVTCFLTEYFVDARVQKNKAFGTLLTLIKG